MLRGPPAIKFKDRPLSSTLSSLFCLNSYHNFCVYIASISRFLHFWKTLRIVQTHFSYLFFSRIFDQLLLQTQETVVTSLTHDMCTAQTFLCIYRQRSLGQFATEPKITCTGRYNGVGSDGNAYPIHFFQLRFLVASQCPI